MQSNWFVCALFCFKSDAGGNINLKLPKIFLELPALHYFLTETVYFMK